MTSDPSPSFAPSVDLFCKVIDNYGDIGVCLRLARQLAGEYGCAVRLFVDDLAPLSRLEPKTQKDAARQMLDGVEIWRWSKPFPFDDYGRPADLVIEAFACDLPGEVIAAMKARTPRPVWINLEYLSAEEWVDEFHAIPSVHPETGLIKTAFFPGFTERTGGLLREKDIVLLDPVHAGVPDGTRQRDDGKKGLTVSLFCYSYAPITELLEQMENSTVPVELLIPEGVAPGVMEGRSRGALTIRRIPFISQKDYDQLLRSCDLNFVRGEDSFLRAQFASKPLIWNIYAQDDAAHIPKLQAFLKRASAKLSPRCAQTLADFHAMWNQGGRRSGADWASLVSCLPELSLHAVRWAEYLGGQESLADRLLRFTEKQIGNTKR
jgi:uncharacterized repeat protein (TIGR03837 family)